MQPFGFLRHHRQITSERSWQFVARDCVEISPLRCNRRAEFVRNAGDKFALGVEKSGDAITLDMQRVQHAVKIGGHRIEMSLEPGDFVFASDDNARDVVATTQRVGRCDKLLDPLDYLSRERFVVDTVVHSAWGIVEHVTAHKPL